MKKRNRSLFSAVLFITVLLFGFAGVSYVFAASGKETPAETIGSFLFRPVQSVFSAAGQNVRRFFENISAAEALRLENEQLKMQVEAYKKEERGIISVQKENERLRALLQMQKKETDYDLIACKLIARTEEGGSSTITINKGEKHGIKKDDAVATTTGLIGKVFKTSKGYSTVVPIETIGSAVGARIVRTQALCVAEGTGTGLRLTFLTEETAPKEGDEVETSGLGGVYPEGFLLGTVRSVSREGVTFTAEVETKGGERQAYEVMVIKEK